VYQTNVKNVIAIATMIANLVNFAMNTGNVKQIQPVKDGYIFGLILIIRQHCGVRVMG